MSQTTYPLGMPEELLSSVREAAKETGLSVADVMRQAIKFGIPQVRRRLSREDELTEVIAETWDKLGPAPTVNWDAIEKR